MATFHATVKNAFSDIRVQQGVSEDLLPRGQRSMSDFSGLVEVVASKSAEVTSESLSTVLQQQPTMLKSFSVSSLSTMVPDDLDREGLPKGFRHGLVPKNVTMAKSTQDDGKWPSEPESDATTLMIRNVPNRYSQDELIDELEGLGFLGTFDFFYAPVDVGSMFNVGYAFVNFVSPAWAAHCRSVVAGYTFEKHLKSPTVKRRAATVSVAHLQGLEANICHYEKAAVSKKACARRSGPVIMPVRENLVVSAGIVC